MFGSDSLDEFFGDKWHDGMSQFQTGFKADFEDEQSNKKVVTRDVG